MDNGLVRCALFSERTLRTGRQQVVEHFTAEIILGLAPELEGLPSAFFPDESYNSEEIYTRFFHGPIFQVLNAVEVCRRTRCSRPVVYPTNPLVQASSQSP